MNAVILSKSDRAQRIIEARTVLADPLAKAAVKTHWGLFEVYEAAAQFLDSRVDDRESFMKLRDTVARVAELVES